MKDYLFNSAEECFEGIEKHNKSVDSYNKHKIFKTKKKTNLIITRAEQIVNEATDLDIEAGDIHYYFFVLPDYKVGVVSVYFGDSYFESNMNEWYEYVGKKVTEAKEKYLFDNGYIN